MPAFLGCRNDYRNPIYEDSDSENSSNSVPKLGDLLYMYYPHDDGSSKRRILIRGRLIAINRSASSTNRYILVIPTFS